MTEKTMDIIGAGIGGLTAARAMGMRGWRVRVHERAPELRAAGAGIIMQPNAMRVFDALDIGDAIRAEGFALEGMKVLDMRGVVLSGTDLPDPGLAVTVDRGILLDTLAATMDAELRTSSALDALEDVGGPCAEWSDATGRRLTPDALIGADGLYSKVRGDLLGPRDIRYAGYTVWRGVADWRHDGLGAYTGEYWGPGQRFGIVPLTDGRTYWYAVEDAPVGEEDGEDPVAELTARFEGWDEACVEVIARTPAAAIMRHDCFDIAPLKSWGRGHVALLGDAAHAMTPNMGQGGCQAVEDGLALGLAFDAHDDTAHALRAYAGARMTRANMFVKRSWDIGRLSQWENGAARALRDLGMRWAPKWAIARQMKGMYQPTGLMG